MKKILFTANLESFYTKFLIPQLKYFKDEGYIVHIATKLDNIEVPYCDEKFNVDFPRSLNFKQTVNAYKQMIKVLKDNEYDIISTHTPFGAAITRMAFKKLKIKNTKIVYMAHGFHFFKGAPLFNWLIYYTTEKYLAKYTDDIITINREDYEIAKKKFKSNIHYVEGVGLDKSKFDFEMSEKEKNSLRKSLNMKDNDFVMIYPAELLGRKRQIWLIKTLAPLLYKYNNIKVLLPGKDSLNGKCQKLVDKLKLNGQVLFLGFRKDIPKLIKISNLAISSSKQEGLPVNVMEAIYCGLPVVATDCRGNRDLVEDGKNGYVLRKKDRKGFNEKILYFYNIKEKELIKIKEYNQRIIKKFLLENVIYKIVNIYKK